MDHFKNTSLKKIAHQPYHFCNNLVRYLLEYMLSIFWRWKMYLMYLSTPSRNLQNLPSIRLHNISTIYTIATRLKWRHRGVFLAVQDCTRHGVVAIGNHTLTVQIIVRQPGEVQFPDPVSDACAAAAVEAAGWVQTLAELLGHEAVDDGVARALDVRQ